MRTTSRCTASHYSPVLPLDSHPRYISLHRFLFYHLQPASNSVHPLLAVTHYTHTLQVESVVPHPARIRAVAENVATAVVLAAQASGLAGKQLGSSKAEVTAALKKAMWSPNECATAKAAGATTGLTSGGTKPGIRRSASDLSGGLDQEDPPDAADH